MTPRQRILVVERLAWLRESIGEVLIKGGYLPCLAASKRDALRQATRCRPAAVLVGAALEDGTGGQVITELCRLEIYAPVVGLSGREDTTALFHNAGVVAIVKKPFTSAELLAAVRAALEIPKIKP